MDSYKIITDCTCDLTQEIADSFDLKVLPMDVTLDGEVFEHHLDFRNCDSSTFYSKLRNGSVASTSQINPQKYIEYFTPILKEGNDILYVCFSSGLSSTFQSSILAKSELEEIYPDRKIHIIDSLAASGGEGLTVYIACTNKKAGMSIDENAAWLNEHRMNIAHWFTVDDLMFLKRGGRLSGGAAIIGSALKIKPVLHVDDDGHLINMAKVHGRKASINALFAKMQETYVPCDHPFIISHGDCEEDALYLRDKVHEAYPGKNVIITTIGPVIGCHSGPGTMTLFFYGKNRD